MRRFGAADKTGDGLPGDTLEEIPEVTQGHRTDGGLILEVANHPDELEAIEEKLRITGSRSPPPHLREYSLLHVIGDGAAIEAGLLFDLVDRVGLLIDHPSTVPKDRKNCQEVLTIGETVNLMESAVNNEVSRVDCAQECDDVRWRGDCGRCAELA